VSSANNPIATADQRDLEARAMRIMAMPVVVRGRQQAAARWRTIVGQDMNPERLSRFDELIAEYTFNYVLLAVNGDPNYPKVMGLLFTPPHDWFGIHVSGSRGGGGDGPDTHYSSIPLDFGPHYELTGQRLEPAAADVSYTLTGNPAFTMTLNTLEGRDVVLDSNGRFTIHLGPEPPAGRENYIQTKAAYPLSVHSGRQGGLATNTTGPPRASAGAAHDAAAERCADCRKRRSSDGGRRGDAILVAADVCRPGAQSGDLSRQRFGGGWQHAGKIYLWKITSGR
jgi:hypothetical protein